MVLFKLLVSPPRGEWKLSCQFSEIRKQRNKETGLDKVFASKYSVNAVLNIVNIKFIKRVNLWQLDYRRDF
jgi:hypothetical protein